MTWMEEFWGRFWLLLETLGWWILLGLLLGWLLQFLPAGKQQREKRRWRIPAASLLGALLPMCNFGAIPIAVSLLAWGADTGATLAFFAGATLLNPAGLLLGWAYLGPGLTVAYGCGAMAAACLTGVAAQRRCAQIPKMEYPQSVRKLILWVMAGILAQALLLSIVPASLWRGVVGNPAGVSLWKAAAAGVARHVCIPDDIALTASLVASGLAPGWGLGLLLLGAATNLPELFALYGMAGKKAAATYLLTMVCAGLLTAILTQLLLGPGFVPHFNLANGETLAQWANLLNIRTWMPAKTPCAIGLLILSGWALWKRGKQWFLACSWGWK